MSATDELRRLCDEAGLHHESRGWDMTAIPVGNVTWYARDGHSGLLQLSAAGWIPPDEVVDAIVGPRATVTSVWDDDGVGHSECGNCGRTVGKHFRFCSWCGSRFVEG